MVLDHKAIEAKWSQKWRDEGVYKVDLDKPGKKWYNLMMFPYPSAEGLHVGNMYAFTGADFYGRYKAMQGYQVFEPIGLDGFGIHSENYAIKIGKHPKEQAKISEKHFYDQLNKLGNRFNWEQKLETYDPEYYKWTQWLFIKMFEKGLAYRKKASVNWCPSCKTVLADEQVEDGLCERCKTPTEKKQTEQWFFKITEYADRLLDNIKTIDWPAKIKTAQTNWIGRSKGLSVDYQIKGLEKPITVWTKYWETVFGTTYLVLAPEHWAVKVLQIPSLQKKAVEDYVSKSLKKSEQERQAGAGDKTGVDTGVVAINPVNGEKVPVWIADYVLAGVGTGAVMGVPAHDERDFAFAKKFKLPIVQVVEYEDKKINSQVAKAEMAYEGEGKLVNSGEFSGLSAWGEGKAKMADWMIKQKFSRWQTDYHLRDWLISRQRYWGPPIPMINCPKCGFVAEKEESLPVLLPDIADYKPTGDGQSPLAKAPKEWLEVNCPKCGGKARRETDVSDTFLDSAWYFLRYSSLEISDQPFSQEALKNWLPVDAYIGGAEHAVLHLLYARFVWMALADWGNLPKELGPEPFPFLFSHGLIIKDGAKMSKSKGNVVNPDEYIAKYGADTLRMYLMFLGPYNMGGDFRDSGMAGMSRFLKRVWNLVDKQKSVASVNEKDSRELQVKLHQTVKKVGDDMAAFKYNTAIAAIMELVNVMGQEKAVSGESLKTLCLMLAPMAPYIAEEMWSKLGQGFSVHQQMWPEYSQELTVEESVTIAVQVNGKLRASFTVKAEDGSDKEKLLELAKNQENVAKYLKDAKLLKEIVVPGRLVNLVV